MAIKQGQCPLLLHKIILMASYIKLHQVQQKFVAWSYNLAGYCTAITIKQQGHCIKIFLPVGVKVQCCCARSLLVMGSRIRESRSTCSQHQETCTISVPETTSNQVLPASRLCDLLTTVPIPNYGVLPPRCKTDARKNEDRVAIPIFPPQSQYRDGIMVTGHRGIQVSRNTFAFLASSNLFKGKTPQKSSKENGLNFQESIPVSESHKLQQAVLERRNEEGEEEIEVGKTMSKHFCTPSTL